jgi:hypothetical protein
VVLKNTGTKILIYGVVFMTGIYSLLKISGGKQT